MTCCVSTHRGLADSRSGHTDPVYERHCRRPVARLQESFKHAGTSNTKVLTTVPCVGKRTRRLAVWGVCVSSMQDTRWWFFSQKIALNSSCSGPSSEIKEKKKEDALKAANPIHARLTLFVEEKGARHIAPVWNPPTVYQGR